jgi:SAM-dependent methyltransferase
MTLNKDWWIDFFDHDYVRFQHGRPYQKTDVELALITSVLEQTQGKILLDACCGYGRHAVPLASLGWQVTGVDHSLPLLELAQTTASEQPPDDPAGSLEWVCADLRQPIFNTEFDAALCMFTSLGYFENDEEDRAILVSIQTALKPGGLFILDLANRDFLVQHPNYVRNWWQRGNETILEETQFNPVTSQATTTNTLISEGNIETTQYRVRLYSLHELATCLIDLGFNIEQAYGNYEGQAWNLSSPRNILVLRK